MLGNEIHPSIQSPKCSSIGLWRSHPSIWLCVDPVSQDLLRLPFRFASQTLAIAIAIARDSFLPFLACQAPSLSILPFLDNAALLSTKNYFPLRCRVERAFPTCKPSSEGQYPSRVRTIGELSSAVSGGVLHGVLPVTAEALKWPANSAVLSCSRSRIRGNPSLRPGFGTPICWPSFLLWLVQRWADCQPSVHPFSGGRLYAVLITMFARGTL